MKKLLPLLLSLVLFAVGCGDKKVSLEEREGLVYIIHCPCFVRCWVWRYTGKHAIFYENGYELVEGNYKDGKLDGLGVEWYENGQKKTEMSWKEGKLDGLQLKWHENGQKEREGNFKDGKADGLGVEWHSNGQKESEFLFKNGKEDGLQLMWHENGQKKSEENFKDGELISKKYWNSKGEEVATLKEARK